jgi:hypothetical protein
MLTMNNFKEIHNLAKGYIGIAETKLARRNPTPEEENITVT